MGSFPNQGPFWGPFYEGVVLVGWLKRGPQFRELPKYGVEGFVFCKCSGLSSICPGLKPTPKGLRV